MKTARAIFESWLKDEGALPEKGLSSAFVGSLLRQEGFRVEKGHSNKTYVYGLRLTADSEYYGLADPNARTK